jgi:hypothetical protein
MKKQEMIKELVGESVIVDAEWLEANDPELLGSIISSKFWGLGYAKTLDPSEAIIEVQFTEEGLEYYVDLEANKDKWPSQNQPPWGEDRWEDWEVEEIEKYYKLLK